jgi:hypothetical protein
VSIADEVRATLLIADYASPDPQSKINIVGAGWQVTGIAASGLTPALAIIAVIELPARFAGEEVALSLALTDEAGELVQMAGPAGEPTAMRVQQLVKMERPSVPGVLLGDRVWTKASTVVYFANGLPLQQNHAYEWRLEIDGVANQQWVARFFVGGPPPGPVIG